MATNEIMEQLQIMMNIMEQFPTVDKVTEIIDERARHTEVLIENTVTKRIDSLFDGYKLTHEKQFELERKNEQLMEMIKDLQNRLLILESKIA